MRAQWDLKRKRDLRKSCPVQMDADVRAASHMVRNNGTTTAATAAATAHNGAAADLMTSSLELGVDLQPTEPPSSAHLVREADQLIQTKEKGKERPKEHVIDDESPASEVRHEDQVAAFFSNFLSDNRQSPKRQQPTSHRRTSAPAPAPPLGGSSTQLWSAAVEEPQPLNGTHKSMSASTLTALEVSRGWTPLVDQLFDHFSSFSAEATRSERGPGHHGAPLKRRCA